MFIKDTVEDRDVAVHDVYVGGGDAGSRWGTPKSNSTEHMVNVRG